MTDLEQTFKNNSVIRDKLLQAAREAKFEGKIVKDLLDDFPFLDRIELLRKIRSLREEQDS